MEVCMRLPQILTFIGKYLFNLPQLGLFKKKKVCHKKSTVFIIHWKAKYKQILLVFIRKMNKARAKYFLLTI